MTMIKTSQGPKTPTEALALFKKAKLPAGDLLGIFNQLEELPEAHQAWEHVLANLSFYNGKIQRLAKEKSTGISIGTKMIRTADDVKKVLEGLDLGSSITLTFAKDGISHLCWVLGMARIIQIDSTACMLLRECVIKSGRWENIPRTYTALVYIRNGSDLEMCQECMPKVVESIKVNCTRKQFMEANDPCPKMLEENPDIFFDENLFTQACTEMGRFSEAKGWIKEMGSDPSMQKVLEVFPYIHMRADFLEIYIKLFNLALA